MITFGYGKPSVLNEDNQWLYPGKTTFSDPPTQAAEEGAEAVDVAGGCTVSGINCVPMTK